MPVVRPSRKRAPTSVEWFPPNACRGEPGSRGAVYYRLMAQRSMKERSTGVPSPAKTARRTAKAASAEVRSRLAEDGADIAFCERHQDEAAKPLRRALKKLRIDEREVGL